MGRTRSVQLCMAAHLTNRHRLTCMLLLVLLCCGAAFVWMVLPQYSALGDQYEPFKPSVLNGRSKSTFTNANDRFSIVDSASELTKTRASGRGASGHTLLLGNTTRGIDAGSGGHPSSSRLTLANGTFKAMLNLYLTNLKNAQIRPSDIAFNACVGNDDRAAGYPCPVKGCISSYPEPEERLRRILWTQHQIEQRYLDAMKAHVNQSEYADIVIIHASSGDHFEESKGLLRGLKEKVFPELRRQNRYSFKFFFYDIGLQQSQIQQLQETCECTVKRFPFDKLPERFRKLKSYVWKPLLFKMHLHHSMFTFWLDACVRFNTGNLTPILDKVHDVGVFTARSNFHMLAHTHPLMLQYFQVNPCEMAPFYETETGFVVMRNDVFTRRAIVDSWVSCSFSPYCLCPDYDGRDCRRYLNCDNLRPEAPYKFECHRYDQSALGTILVSLFGLRATGIGLRNVAKNKNQFYIFAKG